MGYEWICQGCHPKISQDIYPLIKAFVSTVDSINAFSLNCKDKKHLSTIIYFATLILVKFENKMKEPCFQKPTS